jgi:putative DNA primase/helicase
MNDKNNKLKLLDDEIKKIDELSRTLVGLAKLSSTEYLSCRNRFAKELELKNVSELDTLVKEERKKTEAITSGEWVDPEPYDGDLNVEELLDEIKSTIKRFVICDEETAVAATLWLVASWCIDYLELFPKALITAPTKECGKSTLLEVMARFGRNPLTTANISPAALFRTVDAQNPKPCLAIDELDTFMKNNDALTGIFNGSHQRNQAFVYRTEGDNFESRPFDTFCPQILCGIGNMVKPTTESRCILLIMRRKLPHEKSERLRHSNVNFGLMHQKMMTFANKYGSMIGNAQPDIPLTGRSLDNWEPLIAVARIASEKWLKDAIYAAQKIEQYGKESSNESAGIELLRNIREILIKSEKVSQKELLNRLTSNDEWRWDKYTFKGDSLTQRDLTKLLKPFGIKTKTIKVGSEAPKGYDYQQFKESFDRYLEPDESNSAAYPSVKNGNHGHSVTSEDTSGWEGDHMRSPNQSHQSPQQTSEKGDGHLFGSVTSRTRHTNGGDEVTKVTSFRGVIDGASLDPLDDESERF